MADVQRSFFTAPAFAVAGASANTDKFGFKLLNWYSQRSLPVTPVTPTSKDILDIPCVPTIRDLKEPERTSLSIVTPPKVTLSILQDALNDKKLHGLWLQPGAEDASVKDFINENDWLRERTVFGGPCVLVSGDHLRQEVGKQGKL